MHQVLHILQMIAPFHFPTSQQSPKHPRKLVLWQEKTTPFPGHHHPDPRKTSQWKHQQEAQYWQAGERSSFPVGSFSELLLSALSLLTSLLASPLPCYLPSALSSHHFAFSSHFFLCIKSFPNVLPDCTREYTETRMPPQSRAAEGEHVLRVLPYWVQTFCSQLKRSIYFSIAMDLLLPSISLSFSKINFRFVLQLRKKAKTNKTHKKTRQQWSLAGWTNQAACHLFIPLHWFQTDVYKN